MTNRAGGGVLSTVPGFSSRSTTHRFQQFPQRDEAVVTDMQPEPGFSNSAEVKGAPQDVHPDVQPPVELEPGFSNAKAVQVEGAVVSAEATSEPQADAEPKKTAAKKTAVAKKKG